LRFLLNLFAMLVVALSIGFGLSYYALNDGRLFGALQIGPWTAWPRAGSAQPDPYTRAYLARTGALQLGQSEGLEFVSTTDSAGRPLERTCTYRFEGTTPTATFWTLVPTSQAGRDIASSPSEPGLSSLQLVRDADGIATIHIGPRLSPDNWLEVSGSGPFQLVLTFYDVTVAGGATLPTLTREGC
jgi:hypothetical protein